MRNWFNWLRRNVTGILAVLLGVVVLAGLPLVGLLAFNAGAVRAREVYAAQLDEARAENEVLTRRVIELEKIVPGSGNNTSKEYYRGVFDVCRALGFSSERCNTDVANMAREGWFEKPSDGYEPGE